MRFRVGLKILTAGLRAQFQALELELSQKIA